MKTPSKATNYREMTEPTIKYRRYCFKWKKGTHFDITYFSKDVYKELIFGNDTYNKELMIINDTKQ